MLDELPILQILATQSLLLHEKHDLQRTPPLIKRFEESGILINPIIVSPLKNNPEKYVVLDGANRTTAFREMNIPHILAQIVDPSSTQIGLKTWNHAVRSMCPKTLIRRLHTQFETEFVEITGDYPHQELEQERIAARIQTTEDKKKFVVLSLTKDLANLLTAVNTTYDVYGQIAPFNRVRADTLDAIIDLYEDLTALVVFHSFKVQQVLELSERGCFFPAGITRFMISPRVLRVNYRIVDLMSDLSLEEKNQKLVTWIQDRTEKRCIRFYGEPTVLFDE
jgi:hypothetical protein